MKKGILFYTDCFVFGGCEKPIFELIASEAFRSEFEYRLIYRCNREYEDGMNSFRPDFPKEKTTKVHFPDINTINFWLEDKISNTAARKLFEKVMGIFIRLAFPIIFLYELIVLYRLFRKDKSAIIHINSGGYPASLGCRAATFAGKLAGKRVILSVHNAALEKRGFYDRLIDMLVRRSVLVFITGSRASGMALRDKRGFDESKCVTIHHGIESITDPARAPGEDRLISMVARMEERKGHEYVIKALRKLIDNHPEHGDIKLIFIGDGPLFKGIKELVIKEGLQKNITLLGYRKDYISYVASSLFLLNPSLGHEDLPYIILEAMSLGVPVIGTNTGGIPEEIEDGVSGIVLPPADTAGLTGAMLTMLSDDRKRSMMGIEAKKRFRERFTLDRMVERYMKIYDKISKKEDLCPKSR